MADGQKPASLADLLLELTERARPFGGGSGSIGDLLGLTPRAPQRPAAPPMFARPAPRDPGGLTGQFGGPAGNLAPGTVDHFKQPAVRNPRGGVSTVYSFSVNFDGKEYLLPMVTPDGRLLNEQDAIREFQKTGRHLGVFDTPQNATRYADRLHNEYERGDYGHKKPR